MQVHDGLQDSTGQETRLISSEVHAGEESRRDDGSTDSEVVSRIRYYVPEAQHGERSGSYAGTSDEDGDSSVPRRDKKRRRSEGGHQSSSEAAHGVLTLVHHVRTPVDLVGQQLWPAAFLLGDFILTHPEFFDGAQVLELGAGTGFAGLIAARVANSCYLTDYHDDVSIQRVGARIRVLALLSRNVEANSLMIASGSNNVGKGGRPQPLVAVRRLNWLDALTVESGQDGASVAPDPDGIRQCSARDVHTCDGGTGDQRVGSGLLVKNDAALGDGSEEGHSLSAKCWPPADNPHAGQSGDDCTGQVVAADAFTWRDGELSSARRGKLVLLACDVIYDELLTDAFFAALCTLMPARGERRHVPCTNGRHATEDARLPVLYLAIEKRFNFTLADLSVVATGYKNLMRHVWDVTGSDAAANKPCRGIPPRQAKCFVGKRLPQDFRQCFNYERTKHMELWEITRHNKTAICSRFVRMIQQAPEQHR